jgi:hypothetical protein
MFYQLPNGRVIEMSTEQYLDMSDEELEYLIAFNYGDIYENPWHGSILSKHDTISDDLSDIIIPLTDIPEIDKLTDLDADLEIDE